jgi:capsular exopolysaccharide synthesis family protein
MEEFVLYKNEMRAKTSGQTILGLTEEVIRLEKEVNLAEAELAAFRTTNSVVLSQEQGNSAANYLAALNQRLAALKSEYELLNLLSLDQNLERRQQSPDALPLTAPGDATDKGAAAAGDRADTEYFKAKQQVLLLKAEQKELAQDLRPKHPKMIALTEDIARRERLLAIFRQQSAEQMESKKSSLALQTQNLERDVKEWDAKTLEISRKMAEDQRLKANAQRLQTLYERLSSTMRTVETSAPINSESVTISENSKQMGPTKPRLAHKLLVGALAGLAVGLLLLLILDRLDDRMNSFTELQDMFDEPVLGQIPREKSGKESQGATLMIGSEDMRHAFVEAYRNLRSSLLYIAESGTRPRTVIITSSVPGEGKSLTSANLAITLANSGSRVLLVDGDLRKGVLHDLFDAPPEPGLTEVLSQGLTAEQTIQATKVANLSLLPRGAITHRSSELFVHPAAEKFLKDTSAQYDYVLIDTAPVMAADDVTSLAPNMDGTIFVVRADYTSSRLARAALDLLYQRQVKVIGLVFNAVRPTTLDYYYYKYQEYYAAYPTAASAKRAKV